VSYFDWLISWPDANNLRRLGTQSQDGRFVSGAWKARAAKERHGVWLKGRSIGRMQNVKAAAWVSLGELSKT